jgi:hypothetical protein
MAIACSTLLVLVVDPFELLEPDEMLRVSSV